MTEEQHQELDRKVTRVLQQVTAEELRRRCGETAKQAAADLKKEFQKK